MTTDCTVRAEFIAGLRRLADFLAANPKVPVPSTGADIIVHALGSDDEQRAAIDRIAALIDRPASDGDHYTTTRDFGPITYRAVAIPERCMQEWHALMSYDGCISA